MESLQGLGNSYCSFVSVGAAGEVNEGWEDSRSASFGLGSTLTHNLDLKT